MTLTVERFAGMDETLLTGITEVVSPSPRLELPPPLDIHEDGENGKYDEGPIGPKPAGPAPATFSPESADEFAAIEDKSLTIKPQEMLAYNLIVRAVRAVDFSKLRYYAMPAPDYAELIRAPGEHRGQLMKATLDVRRILKVETTAADGKPLYELWGFAGGSLDQLWTVIAVDLPEGIPTGQSVQERLTIAGYFLKLQGYIAAGAKEKSVTVAPALIGRVDRPGRAAGKKVTAKEEQP